MRPLAPPSILWVGGMPRRPKCVYICQFTEKVEEVQIGLKRVPATWRPAACWCLVVSNRTLEAGKFGLLPVRVDRLVRILCTVHSTALYPHRVYNPMYCGFACYRLLAPSLFAWTLLVGRSSQVSSHEPHIHMWPQPPAHSALKAQSIRQCSRPNTQKTNYNLA